jgi:LmbE family N-acetylglucosaminyl deacetylase
VTHSILAIFAHPDDETSAGALLAKYAAEGHGVHLCSITSGQKGVQPHAHLPPGTALGAARERELRLAAAALGIREPVLLGFEDQGISAAPVMEQVAARVREVIDELEPEVVITFGPDGVTGHVDHRATSVIVTEVFQEQARLAHPPRKLYYTTMPESLSAALPAPFRARLRLTSDALISTVVDCHDFLDRAAAAVRCHQTQWRPAFMDDLEALHRTVLGGRVFLRLALRRPAQAETSLFDGL